MTLAYTRRSFSHSPGLLGPYTCDLSSAETGHGSFPVLRVLLNRWKRSTSDKQPPLVAHKRVTGRDGLRLSTSPSSDVTPCPGWALQAMADTIFGSGNDQWVCPNDRQLALRAKLQTGWSVHTYQTEKQRKNQCLSPAEAEAILQVIQRAERLDVLEQQRIGRLVERLETMRRNVMGNGLSQCLLCGEMLGFLGSSSVFCKDCRKKVCTKCGIEASPGQKRPLWLCKICSEQREVWKRSGAWFYRGLPKYILPLKTPGWADDPHFRPLPMEPTEQKPRSTETSRVYTWARGRVVSSDSDSDSDLSSSSLEDRLLPTGARAPKGDKPQRESGGSTESPKMRPACQPSHLSESQRNLASETGTGSADPQLGPHPGQTPRAPAKGTPGRVPAADMTSEVPLCLPWQRRDWCMEQIFQWKSLRARESWKGPQTPPGSFLTGLGALSWPALLDVTSDSTNQCLWGWVCFPPHSVPFCTLLSWEPSSPTPTPQPFRSP
ncbi:LOW QUALITY PROTEIN: rab effector Noc2 [Lynx canadensis]|uniref:LOW QUALITY PROTEIN: rab effector Noc2 n=1 Tax=Lynx canadensis TaxID=61383 RepID=UPI0011B05870|nr:LOW QUALITY PROTEIN: rab effector Noc2 [Lynx canadensis]